MRGSIRCEYDWHTLPFRGNRARVSDWKLTKELTRKPSGLSGIEPDEHPCAYGASAEIGVVDDRYTSLSELLQFLLAFFLLFEARAAFDLSIPQCRATVVLPICLKSQLQAWHNNPLSTIKRLWFRLGK